MWGSGNENSHRQCSKCSKGKISDIYSAKRARLSNNANIACLGAFTTGSKVREELIEAFLSNEFKQDGPSQRKVDAYVSYDENRK